MTRVERLQKTGIHRLGTPKRGFRYRMAQGGKVSAADLERIKSLSIPPAWTDVAISGASAGKIQAIGKDAAGRWQYIYHESQVRARELKKYERMVSLRTACPK